MKFGIEICRPDLNEICRADFEIAELMLANFCRASEYRLALTRREGEEGREKDV